MAIFSQHVLGFTMLTGTLVLWVGSSIILQRIFGEGVEFQRPVFVTLFTSAMSASLLAPRLARYFAFRIFESGKGRSKYYDIHKSGANFVSDTEDLRTILRLSSTVGFLWLCSQWIFNTSLLHTSVATNTVLSSTTTGFTFVFSLLICGDPFRWLSFGAAVFSFLGCVLVALQAPSNVGERAITNSHFGDALTLTSAALFALVSVLLQRLAPGEFDLTSFMGMNGLIAMCLSPALLYAAHHSGVELFELPSAKMLAVLAGNALLGCTLANYLYTSALLLLSPLAANVCLSLSIPVSAFADGVLLGQHKFSAGWALGAALVSIGVFCAALDLVTGHSTVERRDRVDESELQSLLTSGDEDGDEDYN